MGGYTVSWVFTNLCSHPIQVEKGNWCHPSGSCTTGKVGGTSGYKEGYSSKSHTLVPGKQADKEKQLLKKHAMKQLVALLKVYSDIFTQSQRDMGSTDV